jgi:hypothetical protein
MDSSFFGGVCVAHLFSFLCCPIMSFLPMFGGSPGTPASSTKTGCHDIAEILLKMALKTKNHSKQKHNTIFLETCSLSLTNDWVFQIIKLQRPAGRCYYEEGAFSNL